MFLIYALPVGLLVGLSLGGRLAGLAALNFRWGMLAVAGFALQIVLFSDPVSQRIGIAGPPIYVTSTALVLVAVIRNFRITGMPLVVLGAASNLAAIVANGGYMPARHAADAAAGYSNTRVIPSPALEPLTDVIALPAWLPFTNIMSIGDLLIGLGIAVVIAASMRAGRTPAQPAEGSPDPVLEGTSPF
jgi:hypothetical protein